MQESNEKLDNFLNEVSVPRLNNKQQTWMKMYFGKRITRCFKIH